MRKTMATVRSKDGATIAFDAQGEGPALTVVNGAMSTRASGATPALATRLALHLTVYSTATAPPPGRARG